MFLRWTKFKFFGVFLFILALSMSVNQQTVPATAQDEKDRAIIADDFLKNRPRNRKSGRDPRKPLSTYRLAAAETKGSDQGKLQVGVTVWRLERATAGSNNAERSGAGSYSSEEWIPRRVEVDMQFREGDALRISIESPRNGYLYVVNRDWLADGSYGETNLIFPMRGEDNRLVAGKLIDIPAQDRAPFKASPKPNQSSELLTIIVTSSPLQLPLSTRAIPISKTQLMGWEERWGGEADRLEMNGGAGLARTKVEELAASPTRARQLTREDPMPQTIYSVVPKNTNGLLFNLALSYVR